MVKAINIIILQFVGTIRKFKGNLTDSSGLDTLLFHYGWDMQANPEQFDHIRQALKLGSLPELISKAEALSQKSSDGITPEEIASLAEDIYRLIADISNFGSSIDASLPFPFNKKAFWEEFSQRLLEDIFVLFLQRHYPLAFGLFHLFGIIEFRDEEPEGEGRINYTRTVIHWSRLGNLLTGPIDLFKEVYQWGQKDQIFHWEKLLHALEYGLLANRFLVRYVLPRKSVVEAFSDPDYMVKYGLHELHFPFIYGTSILDESFYNIGLAVMPIGQGDMNKPPDGLIVTPVLQGDLSHHFYIAPSIKLNLGVDVSANSVLGVKIYPDGAQVATSLGSAEVNAKIALEGAPRSPWIIAGSRDSHRLELHGFEFYFQASGQVSDPEVKIGMRTLAPNGEGKGMKAVVVLEESDSFLRETTQNEQLEASFDVLMEWSNKTGFRINGSLNFDLNFDLNQKLGPVEITGLSVGLGEGPKRTSQKSTSLRTGLGLKGKLGPVQFEVERMGFALDFIPYTQSDLKALPPDADRPLLGLLDLDYHFLPPKGLALTINAKSVKGGGFLRFDPDNGQYDGVLQLEIGGRIGLNAIGLLQTRLPDGKKGYSFLIIITASGFTPIQLGFGFLLTKVGGLLGIHRGVDTKQVRDGLKSEGLSNVLFPEDPMANVGGIVSSLRTYFPPTQGQYVFGPMGEITWGKPTILRIRLGVLYEFPLANRLHILAQFKAGLPSLDKPLLLLNMDAAGLIDLNSGELAVDAVLYKSNLLGINLSGGMAMRLRGGNDPLFLLSVGGFNPRFKAPAGFPKVDRITFGLAKENDEPPPVGTYPPAETKKPGTRLELQAYFALTSNTVQFGAHLDLYVSAWTFSIEGYLYFDALFQFSPFQFVVDFSGGVCVKWFGYTLFELRLDITLSGPTPWHAKGEAHFSICWGVIDITVSFDRDLSEGTPPPLPPAVNPLPELLEALGDARNWEGEWPENGRSFVSLREIQVESDSVLVHPEVGLRVRQRVLPLGQKLSRVGNNRLAAETQFDIKGLFLSDKNKQADTDGEQTVKDVEDYFAMAQYLDGMSEHEKLSGPSFKPQKAGVAMAASSAIFDEELAIGEDIGFQTWRVLEDTGTLQTDGDESRISGEDLAAQARFGAAGQAFMRRSLKAQLF